MTHIIKTNKRDGDVPVLAMRFHNPHTNLTLVRLVPEPLAQAESLALASLGMKQESHTTVGFTQPRALGFPAHLILTDPDNAHHALNFVKDLQWARRQAKTHPEDVEEFTDNLIAELSTTTPQFLPTFLEEVARAFVQHGHGEQASAVFGRAREIEEIHGIAIDPKRHDSVMHEFAGRGVISGPVFSRETKAASQRFSPAGAYAFFFDLLIAQANAGVATYPDALTDLARLGAKCGLPVAEITQDFLTAYLSTAGFFKESASFLDKWCPIISSVLSSRADLAERFFREIPNAWEWDVALYMEGLKKFGLWQPLISNPASFTSWLSFIIDHGNSHWHFNFFRLNSHQDLLAAIDGNKRQLNGVKIAVRQRVFHPDYLDAFLGAGAQLSIFPFRGEVRSDVEEHFDIELSEWIKNHSRDLSFLVEWVGSRRDVSFDIDPTDLVHNLDVLLSYGSTRNVVKDTLDTLHDKRKRATGSQEAWYKVEDFRPFLDDPRLRELNAEAVAGILHCDPVEELAVRLRRGTVVEYTWPLFEALADEDYQIFATYPWVSLVSERHIRVCDGAQVREFQRPPFEINLVIPTETDVFVSFTVADTDEPKWMWLSERIARSFSTVKKGTIQGNYPRVIEGTLYAGPVAITATTAANNAGGQMLGFGPFYAISSFDDSEFKVLPDSTWITEDNFTAQFAAQSLPGLDIPAASAVAASHNAWGWFDSSFTVSATDSTRFSPLGWRIIDYSE